MSAPSPATSDGIGNQSTLSQFTSTQGTSKAGLRCIARISECSACNPLFPCYGPSLNWNEEGACLSDAACLSHHQAVALDAPGHDRHAPFKPLLVLPAATAACLAQSAHQAATGRRPDAQAAAPPPNLQPQENVPEDVPEIAGLSMMKCEQRSKATGKPKCATEHAVAMS